VLELKDGFVLYHGSYCEVKEPDLANLVSSSNQISLLWIILCKPLIRNITLLLPAVQRSFRLSCSCVHILSGMTFSQLAGTYSGNVNPAYFATEKR